MREESMGFLTTVSVMQVLRNKTRQSTTPVYEEPAGCHTLDAHREECLQGAELVAGTAPMVKVQGVGGMVCPLYEILGLRE